MIGKLTGIIDKNSIEGSILIDVSGVGYMLFCSKKTSASLEHSKKASLLIETHVREDHIHLYAFVTIEEKKFFNLLQSVKGVGTKMALAILSELSPSDIANSLGARDAAMFNRVPGVGKKLSERIITELKDKFDIISNISSTIMLSETSNSTVASDAISALVSLGISKNDAYNRVSNIINHSPNLTINDIIKLSLQNNS